MQENMKYTRESKIVNLIDVVKFFEHLLYEKNLSYHPDDDFSEYVQQDDKRPCLTNGEVVLYNQLRNQCFKVC